MGFTGREVFFSMLQRAMFAPTAYVAPWAQGSAGNFFARGVRGIFRLPWTSPWTPGAGPSLPQALGHTVAGCLIFVSHAPLRSFT